MSNYAFTADQAQLMEMLMCGHNVFVTGDAGVGKTYCLKAYIQCVKNLGKKVLVTAPTGIAARNIDGITIHRAFMVPTHAIDPRQEAQDPAPWVVNADVIIIDEISMVRIDVFDYVAKVIAMAEEKSGMRKQLILIGDFFQLPPVLQAKDTKPLYHWYGGKMNVQAGYAFMAKNWTRFNFLHYQLTTVVRQEDASFSRALHKLREGSIAGLRWVLNHQDNQEFKNAPWICPTRKKVLGINEEALRKLDGAPKIYYGERRGVVQEDDMPADEKLVLKVGARVMILTNAPDGEYQNGSFATVLELRETSVIVRLDSPIPNHPDTVEIGRYQWTVHGYSKVWDEVEPEGYDYAPRVIGTYAQIPLKLAYAFTVHKVQGQTFKYPVNIDISVFCKGQLYTALSRVTDIRNVHIEGDPGKKYQADAVVKKFYARSFTSPNWPTDLSDYDGETIDVEVVTTTEAQSA